MESSITINYTINKMVALTKLERETLSLLLKGFSCKGHYFQYLSTVLKVNVKVIVSMSEGLDIDTLLSDDFVKSIANQL